MTANAARAVKATRELVNAVPFWEVVTQKMIIVKHWNWSNI